MKVAKKLLEMIHKMPVEIVIFIFFISCLSPIDIESDNIGGRLVVNGQITPLQERNTIQLGLTASSERSPVPLSGANITLHDDLGASMTYQEKLYKRGVYELNAVGVPGRTYHIRISIEDGQVYESVPEKMPEIIGRDSLYYKFQEEDFTGPEGTVLKQDFLKGYGKTFLPSSTSPVYLRWDTEEVYIIVPTDFPDPFGRVPPSCFITQPVDPQRINLFNGAEFKTSIINEQNLFSRLVDRSFHTRHYFTIYQSSHTAESFEYWRKVNIVANQVGSVFDAPPAEINGNIRNISNPAEKVYGYFQALNQTFNRFYVLASDLPNPTVPYCEYSSYRDERSYPPECLNCILVGNSSYQRPEWF
jgi:hypothetical protein